jgi:hypothetical protein
VTGVLFLRNVVQEYILHILAFFTPTFFTFRFFIVPDTLTPWERAIRFHFFCPLGTVRLRNHPRTRKITKIDALEAIVVSPLQRWEER